MMKLNNLERLNKLKNKFAKKLNKEDAKALF